MSFTPRFNSDGISNSPYYTTDNPFYNAGYGMPNCTAYAWGRFWEEAPNGGRPNLSTGNAEDWFNNVADGYERGQTPKLGAVLCFSGGSSTGHVAIVEQINPDNSIITSNSGWQSTFFWTETCYPPNYNNDGYTFQGFIYNPNVQGGAPPEPSSWISANRYLSSSEQDSNAIKFYYTMSRLGVSYNAILGMLANIESESTINPGIWESLDPFAGGYGLVQWTPYTKYSEWAGAGWEDNGQKECERIYYEAQNGIQWFENYSAPDVDYPIFPPVTFAEYINSNLDPKILADYWLLYYEHPYEGYISDRIAGHQAQVDHYNNLLNGGGPVPGTTKKIWLYLKAAKDKRTRKGQI